MIIFQADKSEGPEHADLTPRLEVWSVGGKVTHALLNQVTESGGRLWGQQQAALPNRDGNDYLRAVHAAPGARPSIHLPTQHAKRVHICGLCLQLYGKDMPQQG